MNYFDKIHKGVDYIEDHLEDDLTLEAVARAAGMSQWHFQRIFKALTHETLKTYIRARRMSQALTKLLHTKERILDIALAAGFDTQESFTRAFKRQFKMNPNQFRKLGDGSLFLAKPEFDKSYLQHINQNLSLEPEVREFKAMSLVGIKTTFTDPYIDKNTMGKELGPLWQNFLARLSEIENKVPGVCYGLLAPKTKDKYQLDYYAAIEVRGTEEVPQGMSIVEVPAATRAVFAHKGAAANLDQSVDFIYSNWLLNSGQTHTYAADLEIYGSDYHPTSASSVIYYGVPIKGQSS